MFVAEAESRVGCCACDFNNLHPVEVSVNRGGVVTTIDSDGERIDPGREPEGRGVRISITYHCECGAKFTDTQHFHKGHTYINRVVHEWPEPDGTDDDEPQELVMRETIWRD